MKQSSFIKGDSFKDEFLTPLSAIFDDLFQKQFPQLFKDLNNVSISTGAYPKVDIVEYPNRVQIVADVAGWKKEDIKLLITNDGMLYLHGNRKIEQDKTEPIDHNAKGIFLKKELRKTSFNRGFTVSDKLDKRKITSKYDNGELIIDIQKRIPDLEGDEIEIKIQ